MRRRSPWFCPRARWRNGISGKFPRRRWPDAHLQGAPIGAVAEDDGPEARPVEAVPRRGALSHLSAEPLDMTIEAPRGPGGLDRQVTLEVGVSDRRASQTSDEVHLKTSRFSRQHVGGTPEFDRSATVAADSFRHRDRRGEGSGELARGTGPETEEAIELGLAYVARVQTADGRWTLDAAAEQDGLPQFSQRYGGHRLGTARLPGGGLYAPRIPVCVGDSAGTRLPRPQPEVERRPVSAHGRESNRVVGSTATGSQHWRCARPTA